MTRFRRWLVWMVLALGSSTLAATPLTTIQDVLYTATGSRFTGVVTITWKSFDAADTSNVTAQAHRVQVSNGILYVQLIPTTNAVTAASYMVQYSSDMTNWKTAVKSIVAAGTAVQWMDDGPPKTDTPPSQAGSRFYRVFLLPAN